MITVSGKTKDDQGYLPYVNIREVGTSNSTQSDDSGNFVFNVNSNASQLQFSYVGYGTVTLAASVVNQQKIIDLAIDSELLNEVVIPPNPNPGKDDDSNFIWWLYGGIVVVGFGIALYINREKPKLGQPKLTKKRKVKKAKKTVHVSL